MKNTMNYWLAELLILVFYIMALIIYNRARNEYKGGKIAAAINLIMVFLVVLFISDVVDYFFIFLFPLGPDTILILKILLRLFAICILFFGGLRFFVGKPESSAFSFPSPLKKQNQSDGEKPDQTQILNPDQTIEEKSADTPETAVPSHPSLGRYKIIKQIGQGAMGVVYKGHDPKLNRPVAIKTIRFSDDFEKDRAEEIKKQFYREAEVVAGLSHPNIVSVYDAGEDMDLSYLAMEYLEGKSLTHLTTPDNLLPVRQCIHIIVQVCDALEYAHQEKIIHRDIKPANIMLLPQGVIKVTDFGIARAMEGSKTRTGIIKGTPYYLSPEQAKGKPLTGASDIFSLGVVFYQLLTGRLPFTGDNLMNIIYQITTKTPDPPDQFNPNINKATLSILNRALEKKPENRYHQAKHMGDHLRRLSMKMDEVHRRLQEQK